MKKIILIALMGLLSACASKPAKDNQNLATLIPVPDAVPGHPASEPFIGGLSGLFFEGKNLEGEEMLLTLTDRGPNGEEQIDPATGNAERPFLKPDFQPRWFRFALDRTKKTLRFVTETLLKFPNGKPITGLPNLEPTAPHGGDEIAVTSSGDVLAQDLMGIDPESICKDESGTIWMGEEYRPSILKFSANGVLQKRYVPKGSFTPAEIQKIDQDNGHNLVLQVLPQRWADRQKNRGFEALACLKGKIFALLQSALPTDDPSSVRMLEFDPTKEEITRELVYDMDSKRGQKIGDMTTAGEDLLVVEQNGKTGPESFHQVFRVSPGLADSAGKMPKSLVVDLVKVGYSFADKVEGLAVLDDHALAVVNDNDFGVNEAGKKTVLGIIPIQAPLSR